MKLEYIFIFTVLAMFPLRWIIVTLGIPEALGVVIFFIAIFFVNNWLLNRVRCEHCGELLCQLSVSIEKFVFWNRYYFLRGRCPHCDMTRNR